MLATLLLLATAAAPADAVVARAGATPITAAELAERARVLNAPPGREHLDALVDEALLGEEGYRLGLQRDPAVREPVAAERLRAAAQRLVEKEIRPSAVPTEAMLREMFHATNDRVRVELALFRTQEEAASALARLAAGADLPEIAREGIDAGGRAGGEWRTRGELGAAAEPLFAAPLATFVGPLSWTPGFAVARVLAREVAGEEGLPAYREKVGRFAQTALEGQMKRHLVEQLRKGAAASVDEEFLSSTGSAVDLAPEAMARVVARAGERTVSYARVAADLRRLFGPRGGGHLTGKGIKIELARAALDELLLGEEALRRGFGEDPEVLRAVARVERAAVGQRLLARVREEAPAPTEAEIAAHHRAHQAELRIPTQRRCGHILLPSRERAEELLAGIRSDEDFAAAAKAHSLDAGTREKDGCLCDLTDDHLDALRRDGAARALADALRNATPGTTSRPVRSAMGWHLVRCKPPVPGRLLGLAEARERVAATLRERAADAAVKERVASLRRKADLFVDEAALARALAPRTSR